LLLWLVVSASSSSADTGGGNAPAPLDPLGIFTDPPSGQDMSVPASPPNSAFDGLAGNLPTAEQAAIFALAGLAGVDPRFLAAIRVAEGGGPGREFGVVSQPTTPTASDLANAGVYGVAGTFWAQGRIAAASIRANMTRYQNQTGRLPQDASGNLTQDFIAFFGARWAPLDAANDPKGLNVNWVPNATMTYESSSVVQV
jgi:hypothetical protein